MKSFILICLMAAVGCVSMEGLRQGPPVPGSEKGGKPAASSRMSYNGIAAPGDALAATALDNERLRIEGRIANDRARIERGYGRFGFGYGSRAPNTSLTLGVGLDTVANHLDNQADPGAVQAGSAPGSASEKDKEQDGRLGDLENDIDLTIGVTKRVISIACPDDPKRRPKECDEKKGKE